MGAAGDLIHDYQHVIDELAFVMGSKGIFEVVVDGEVLFSKKAEGRHAAAGEVLQRFRDRYANGVAVYKR